MRPALPPQRAAGARIAGAALAAIFAVLALAGCGTKSPAISALEWRLETRPAEGGADYESLSVFVSMKADEGLDNLAEFWVVNDDSALAWKFTDSDWIKAAEGGDTWIGASALAGPELTALPRGTYRFIAIDAAGERVEKNFGVLGTFPDRAAPKPILSEGKFSISSAWPETLTLAFDGTGALLASPPSPAQPSPLAQVLGQDIASRTAEIGAYGYDPALRMGAFSKRLKTR